MFSLLKKMNKKQGIFILICVVFITLQVYLDLKLPDYMTSITRLVQTEGSKISDVLTEGLKMMLCAFGSLISAFITGYFASYVAASFGKNLRSDIFRKVESFGMEELKKFSTSSLITRTTNDVTQVQMIIAIGLQIIVKAPIMATWAIIKIAGKGFLWSLATIITVLIILLLISIIILIVLPKFKKIQTLTDNLNRVTRENLKGIRVVRAYNAEAYQEHKFKSANEDLTNTHMFTQRMMSLMMPVLSLCSNSLTLAIYIIGAYLINGANFMDKINIFSNMVVFTSYAMQVIVAFMLLVVIFVLYPRSAVSAKRIKEVLKSNSSINDGTKTTGKKGMIGKVEFKNVSFKYPDAESYMLKDVTFTANKGETVAFIGSTGSGKSTLINLIPRFYDATSGEVLLDGINVKDYKLESLYNKIGYVPQKAVMFTGSVNSNVSYGKSTKKITNKDIKEAVNIAQAEEFVDKMDNKYESSIAQGGTNISGGQKQRLAIARAIARKPEVYIFDDSFSALDYKTDASLRKELKKHTKDATTLIVAQRIGTIMNADKIVVLDKGKVVGIGTHKDLLKNCSVYKEIALSQLSEEEL